MRALLDIRIPIPAQAIAVTILTGLWYLAWWIEFRINEGITTSQHLFWSAASSLAPGAATTICVFMLISHFREARSHRRLVYLTVMFAISPWLSFLLLMFTI